MNTIKKYSSSYLNNFKWDISHDFLNHNIIIYKKSDDNGYSEIVFNNLSYEIISLTNNNTKQKEDILDFINIMRPYYLWNGFRNYAYCIIEGEGKYLQVSDIKEPCLIKGNIVLDKKIGVNFNILKQCHILGSLIIMD